MGTVVPFRHDNVELSTDVIEALEEEARRLAIDDAIMFLYSRTNLRAETCRQWAMFAHATKEDGRHD